MSSLFCDFQRPCFSSLLPFTMMEAFSPLPAFLLFWPLKSNQVQLRSHKQATSCNKEATKQQLLATKTALTSNYLQLVQLFS